MPSKPRLFSERCSTCVFRPGNPMHLQQGRLADVIAQNRAAGTVLICHKTTYQQAPELGEVMCRGYFDAYGDDSNVVRVMERLHTLTGDPGRWYTEVLPPGPHPPAEELTMPTRIAMRVLTDPARPDEGPFVAFYDPDAHDGAGELQVTDDPAQALTFATTFEALEVYGAPSTIRPVRPDGRPNKPLTALTISIEHLEV